MARQKLPEDPRDYYVHNDISIEELAKLYKGKKGCSLGNLKRRCRFENWESQLSQNYSKTILKTDEKAIEKKSDQIASDLSWRGMFRNTMREEMLSVVNEIKLARTSGLIGLTVQDGEGFLNKVYEIYQKGAIDLLKEMEKHDMKLELVEAEKPPEPDKPQFDPASYTDIWRWTEEEKLIFFATGQRPEKDTL